MLKFEVLKNEHAHKWVEFSVDAEYVKLPITN